jgi:hypothetical protein
MTEAPSEVPEVTVTFSGAATIRQVDEIADRLGQALARSGPILLDCSGLEEVDFSFIQLVVAAQKQAARQGTSLAMASPARGALLDALAVCGVDNGPRRDFWLHQQGSAV